MRVVRDDEVWTAFRSAAIDALARLWPKWRPICLRRPAGTVPWFRVAILAGGTGLRIHSAQRRLTALPDEPETNGASRADLQAAIDLGLSMGRIPVLLEISLETPEKTYTQWMVADPDAPEISA